MHRPPPSRVGERETSPSAAPAAVRPSPGERILALQRTAGNRAVVAMLAGRPAARRALARTRVQTAAGAKEVVDLTLAEAQAALQANPADALRLELEEHVEFFDVRQLVRAGQHLDALTRLVAGLGARNPAAGMPVALEVTDDYSTYFTAAELQDPAITASVQANTNADGLTRGRAEMTALRGSAQPTTVIVKRSKFQQHGLVPLRMGILVSAVVHELQHARQEESGTAAGLKQQGLHEYDAYVRELTVIEEHVAAVAGGAAWPRAIPLPTPWHVEQTLSRADRDHAAAGAAAPAPAPSVRFATLVADVERLWAALSAPADALKQQLLDDPQHAWIGSVTGQPPPPPGLDDAGIQALIARHREALAAEEAVLELFAEVGRARAAREHIARYEARIAALERERKRLANAAQRAANPPGPAPGPGGSGSGGPLPPPPGGRKRVPLLAPPPAAKSQSSP